MDDQFLEAVKTLKEKGLSERKIAAELKVSRSKVHDSLQGLKQSEDSKSSVPEEKLREIIREELKLAHDSEEEEDKEKANGQFPVMRKMGGGVEVIAPEAVLRQYMGGTPEEELELRAIMKFRAAMLMVMDLVTIQKGSAEADARRLEPILRLMKETREEQDAAAARAKASTHEIAREAAQEAVGSVLGYIEEKIPKAPPPKTVDEAYAKRIDRVMDMMWNVMEQQMFPNKPLEGWETETVRLPTEEAKQAATPEKTQNPVPGGNLDGWETEEKKEAENA